MPAITDAWLDAHRVDPATLAAAPMIGIGHVDAEINSLVARLSDPERAARLGAEIPRSLLLHGQAGVGKTHSARALAVRLGGLPVYEVGADELTAPIVRSLFAALDARHERSLLVVDEIDLVGGERSESDAATRRTLAALLVALDGLRPAAGVLLAAATSQSVWDIDPALMRAGRLGFVVELRLPEAEARRDLLAFFLGDRPLAPDVDLAPLAALSSGDTPADLRAACADAAGMALAAGRDAIGQGDLLAAFARGGHVLPESPEPGPLDLAGIRQVCAHEAGHVLVGAVLHGLDRLNEVRIAETHGQVQFDAGHGPGDESWVRDAIATLLAGPGAERQVLGRASPGNGSDVRDATLQARRLVGFGFEPGIGPIDLRADWLVGTAVADRAADAVARVLAAERVRAEAILADRRDGLRALASALEAEAVSRLGADRARRPAVIDVEALRATAATLLGDNARKPPERRGRERPRTTPTHPSPDRPN